MIQIRKVGEKTKFGFVRRECIGCTCFQPGHYQHRGATGSSGSRNTGKVSATCMQNAYRGCPDEADRGYSKELAAERKREGWRIV